MKKVLSIFVLAMMMLSPAVAAKKEKIRLGVGVDVIGVNEQFRVSFDGVVPDLRIDGRVGYLSDTGLSGLSFGAGAYYDISEFISIGGHFDSEDEIYAGNGVAGVIVGGQTKIAGVLKAEKEFLTNFAIGVEFGLQKVSGTGVDTMDKYSAVTARIFF